MPNTPHQRLLPIAQDIGVPAEYWQQGAAVPPGATATRWSRLNDYRDLYDGDWAALQANDFEIQDNYFASIVDFWADLMLSYPPMLSLIHI